MRVPTYACVRVMCSLDTSSVLNEYSYFANTLIEYKEYICLCKVTVHLAFVGTHFVSTQVVQSDQKYNCV